MQWKRIYLLQWQFILREAEDKFFDKTYRIEKDAYASFFIENNVEQHVF